MQPPLVTRVDSFSVEDVSEPPPPVEVPEPPAPPVQPSTPAPVQRSLEQHAVIRTLGMKTRVTILEILSDGSALTATELHRRMHLNIRRVMHHLAALCRCGLLYRKHRADRREVEHAIPPDLLQIEEDGRVAIDFGTGVIRLQPTGK